MVNILIRYLGIKTKLLEPIKKAIDGVTPPNSAVLDLFAGSNTVAQYLIENYKIYTNDCQKYSYITAKALIEHHSSDIIESLNSDIVFGKYYNDNKKELSKRFSKPLKTERQLLKNIQELYYGKTFDEFTDFFNKSAYINNTNNVHDSFKDCLIYFNTKELGKYRLKHKQFPYTLFTLYYGNPYFSIQQCIEIDSIKYSIDKLLESAIINDEQHSIYLSFLIYCLNLIVISVGDHFAQPQKIKQVSENLADPRDNINIRERKKIIKKKRTIVKDLYLEKMFDYKNNYKSGDIDNRAFNLDYKILLSSNKIKEYDIKTVYIDPPYTNAHYSRFYHIPETLVKYDYPEIKFMGRYRTDRYQSNFCIKSKAEDEFCNMIKLCKNNNLNAIISYSDTSQCILSIENIKNICNKYYNNSVKIENIAHMYRNFGQKPNRILAKEYIITCYSKE